MPTTIVLVSIDTWRRDASGFLGNRDPSPTPFLDRLAGRGLVATNAWTPVPLTAPSHWSMLSGRWPWTDDVRVNGDRPKAGQPTLAEILSSAGWRTAAFVSCAVLDRRSGLDRGFDTYDDHFLAGSRATDAKMVERRADATVDAAIAWARSLAPEDHAFLWVHLFDPHFPYDPPQGPLPGPDGTYLGEVAFADRQAERLYQALSGYARDLKTSLWIVAADHGEGLGEHAERSHGLLLHGATTRIPMIVAGTGVSAGRLTALVSTVDILPTIASAAGATTPARDGVDLLAEPGPDRSRSIPMESQQGARGFGLAPVVGLRTGRWLWEASPDDHLWDVEIDPAEERDISVTRSETVKQLRHLRETAVPARSGPAPEVDTATRERLRALGYASGPARPTGADVRAFLRETAGWCFRVTSLAAAREYRRADEFARKCLDRQPQAVDMWVEAGFVSIGLGEWKEAEHRFRAALDLRSDYRPARLNLANVLWKTGRPAEAEAEYRKVLEAAPNDPFALYNLGRLLGQDGRDDEARPFWRRFLDTYPDHPRAAEVAATLRAASPPER